MEEGVSAHKGRWECTPVSSLTFSCTPCCVYTHTQTCTCMLNKWIQLNFSLFKNWMLSFHSFFLLFSFLFFLLLLFSLRDRVSMRSSSCPRTHFVNHTGLRFTEISLPLPLKCWDCRHCILKAEIENDSGRKEMLTLALAGLPKWKSRIALLQGQEQKESTCPCLPCLDIVWLCAR